MLVVMAAMAVTWPGSGPSSGGVRLQQLLAVELELTFPWQ